MNIHHKGGEGGGAPLPINPPVHLPFPFPHLKNKASMSEDSILIA